MRSRFLRLVLTAAARLERQGEMEAALQYLEHGLEKAPGAEPLQQQLDLYLQRMGLGPASSSPSNSGR